MNLPFEATRYRNTTEELARHELEKQWAQGMAETDLTRSAAEILAYALNRLPPLYCTTQEGQQWQQEQTQETLAKLLGYAVKYGILRVTKAQETVRQNQFSFQTKTPLFPQRHGVRYLNTMEILVQAEVERQLPQLPLPIARLLKPEDVIAYALNRLPTLYCTTQEGQHWQQAVTQKRMGDFIASLVQTGLTIAQRRDRRFSTPLVTPSHHVSKIAAFAYPLAS